MIITELLVTAYEGAEPRFAAAISPEDARAVFVMSAQDGTATVTDAAEDAQLVFQRISALLQGKS
jgi:hypothetical protein